MLNLRIDIKKIFLFLAIICFGWLLSINEGLIIGDLDDWDHILASAKTPWHDLASEIFSPVSHSKYWFGQVDLFDQTHYSRVFHSIILKLVHQFFSFTPFAYYFWTKITFFLGTFLLVSLFVFQVTQSKLFTIFGSIFFLLVPAYYSHALWLSDPVTITHFFVCLGFFALAKLDNAVTTKKQNQHYIAWLMLFLISGWFGIKTKTPGVIVPIVALIYSFLLLFRQGSHKLKVFLLLFAAGLLLFQIVPVFHLGQNTTVGFPFSGRTIFRMLFRNFDCGYDNETSSAFISLKEIWPVSIARTFGFFMLWTIVLSVLIYLVNHKKTAALKVSFTNHPLIYICTIWAFVEILLMGKYQPDPRYFSGTMIPLIVIVCRLFFCVSLVVQKPFKKIYIFLTVFSVLYSVYVNMQHVIWLRMHIGQRNILFYKYGEQIFQDRFARRPKTIEEIGAYHTAFFCDSFSCAKPTINDVTYFTELEFNKWNKTPDGNLNNFSAAAKTGAIYYGTFDRTKLINNERLKLVDSIIGTNEKSVFEQLSYRLKGKKPPTFYIYKWIL